MRKSVVVLIVSLVLFFSSLCEAEQLLKNPSFDKGGLKSWAVSYNPNNWSTADSSGHKNVARCWWDGGMKQLISSEPGKSYELSADVFVPEGGSESGWGCWLSLDWYDKEENKIGSAWSIAPHEAERGKWNGFDSGKRRAPKDAAFACVDFGVWQSDATPANPIDFDNFLLEKR